MRLFVVGASSLLSLVMDPARDQAIGIAVGVGGRPRVWRGNGCHRRLTPRRDIIGRPDGHLLCRSS